MALRDQPYLPLYIQDIMTDEKLNECSASTHGIYIKGIMCLMHKSEPYGKILLKQKYKQTDNQISNFALQLAKNLLYTENEILLALTELINEGVCHFEGDYLVQKRMVKDNEISEKRALAGKKGGNETQKQKNNDKKFAKAKSEANSVNEYVNENVIKDKDISSNTFEGGMGETLNEEREKKIVEATEVMMKDFKFTSIANPNKQRQISDFIRKLFAEKRIEYFIEQYPAYWQYKKLSGSQTQGLDTFINGGWDRENWVEKLKEFKGNGTKPNSADEKKRSRDAVAEQLRNMRERNNGSFG